MPVCRLYKFYTYYNKEKQYKKFKSYKNIIHCRRFFNTDYKNDSYKHNYKKGREV